MRLRPSGRAGPLATQIGGFTSYQETEAWTWEHMALTRARVVSASPAFGARVEKVIRDILRRPRDAELIAGDVVEMRGAIAKEKGDRERWDLKYAAGGLVDIEFIAQYLQLVHAHKLPDILDTSTARVLDKAWALRVLPVEEAEVLRPAVQLLSGPHADPAAVPAGSVRSQDRGRRAAAPAGARRRRAGLRHARCHADRDAGESARQFRADFGKTPSLKPLLPSAAGIAACSGRRTTTSVPLPSVERMRMRPPCSSTSDLAMASPRPEP